MERATVSATETSLPKTSRIQRWLVLGALALTGRRGLSSSGVWRLPYAYVIKYGEYEISEAEAMCFVAHRTTIPVPKLYCAFERKKRNDLNGTQTRCYMVMQKVKGQELRQAWKTMSSGQKEAIVEQLKRYMAELRTLRPTAPGVVSSVNYEKLNDKRIDADGFGPYRSVAEFQAQQGFDFVVAKKLETKDDTETVRLARTLQTKIWETRFTHADLNSSNILVHRGKITAIVDWERSGWFPEYYEFTSAHFSNPYDSSWWVDELTKILDVYNAELQMDTWRHEQFTFV